MGLLDFLQALLKPVAKWLPTLSMDDRTEAGELQRMMRTIIDHPVVKNLPFLAVLTPFVACVLIWAIAKSPGIAIGAALLLYAQMSALSSRHVISSLWATTTMGIRRAVANGRMSKTNRQDLELVSRASQALFVYAGALLFIVPLLNVLLAVVVLILTFQSRGIDALPDAVLNLLFAAVACSIAFTFIPNRIFVRHASKIISKARGEA